MELVWLLVGEYFGRLFVGDTGTIARASLEWEKCLRRGHQKGGEFKRIEIGVLERLVDLTDCDTYTYIHCIRLIPVLSTYLE